MKIAIASKGDPFSASTWSGIPYHMVHYLKERGCEVVGINLKKVDDLWSYNWFRRINYLLKKLWFLSDVEPYILKKIGQQFDAEVNSIQPDVVLVIHGDFLAYTSFKQPCIIIHDTTFALLINYYPSFYQLTKRSIKNGNKMYQLALDKCKMAIFSSRWASDSAINDYHTDSKKIVAIPFGANLINVPEESRVAEYIDHRTQNDALNFLFLGSGWKRKGGSDALRFVKALNEQGVKSKLIIVGCRANVSREDQQFVIQKGFLNKNIPEQKIMLEKLFEEAHALLLLSVAECFGCVYCEANAFGLPALGRETGGVSEIIKDNINGLLLEEKDTPEEFAKKWLSIWENKSDYIDMSKSARKEFDNRLNYKVFSLRLDELMQKAVSETSQLAEP